MKVNMLEKGTIWVLSEDCELLHACRVKQSTKENKFLLLQTIQDSRRRLTVHKKLSYVLINKNKSRLRDRLEDQGRNLRYGISEGKSLRAFQTGNKVQRIAVGVCLI